MTQNIQIAKIAGAHGIKGLVKLAVYLEDARDIESYNPVTDAQGKNYEIKLKNSTGKFWLAEVSGVTDRNKAEELAGTSLFIPRSALPDVEEGDILHADLIGMKVEDTKGNIIGTVRDIKNFGAGDLLDIGNKTMLPLNAQFYDEIDTGKGVFKINEAAEELIAIIKS
ncbi:MAG: 16S rRNA processing protein RimM [Alphaproteobacteria bacterium]|nr:16S rRNA processing protein RimM [Alphaproteobacteria bacterium]